MEKLLIVGSQLAADGPSRSVVEREGYQPVLAATRHEALDALRAHSPACALVDDQLEGDDGLAVLATLTRVDPSCGAILVTKGGDTETAIQALRAGALDYLRKPVDVEQLRVALGRVRERRPPSAMLEQPAVLVIEHHEPTRSRLVSALEKEGYRVYSATEGAEGLAVFRSTRVDVILTALRMPHMSGFEVLEQTKGKGADVEVVVITGHGNEDDVVRTLRLGASNFLRKPVDLEQMRLSIQKAVEVLQARRSLACWSRDVALMEELVLRLTGDLEVVVEASPAMKPEASEFLRQLVDSLPIGIVVVGADRAVRFANRHVTELAGQQPTKLSVEWLQKMQIPRLTEEQLGEAFDRARGARAGTIETVTFSRWALLVMASLHVKRADRVDIFVALVIRGERGGWRHREMSPSRAAQTWCGESR